MKHKRYLGDNLIKREVRFERISVTNSDVSRIQWALSPITKKLQFSMLMGMNIDIPWMIHIPKLNHYLESGFTKMTDECPFLFFLCSPWRRHLWAVKKRAMRDWKPTPDDCWGGYIVNSVNGKARNKSFIHQKDSAVTLTVTGVILCSVALYFWDRTEKNQA